MCVMQNRDSFSDACTAALRSSGAPEAAAIAAVEAAALERDAAHMNPSAPFVLRPVATSLLMIAILLVGLVGYSYLPLSALPEVDYPTIQVQTFLPGASPEVMTSSVTAPLEKQFGQMPGLDQMSSVSSAGASVITLQFDLSLSLDIAEQEVQAAIQCRRQPLAAEPSGAAGLRQGEPGRRADYHAGDHVQHDAGRPRSRTSPIRASRRRSASFPGVGLVSIAGGQRPAVRIQANLQALAAYGLNLDDLRTTIANAIRTRPRAVSTARRSPTPSTPTTRSRRRRLQDIVVAYKNGSPVHLSDVANVVESAENVNLLSWMNKTPAILLNVQRQPGANVIAVVDSITAMLPQIKAGLPAGVEVTVLDGPHHDDPRLGLRRRVRARPGHRARRAGDLPLPAQHSGDLHPEPVGAALHRRHFRGDVSARLFAQQPVADGR